MKTVDEWKALLRTKLRVTLGAKGKPALIVLRETLAAIENAEAPPAGEAMTSVYGPFAGSAGTLGAGDVERVVLSPEALAVLIERELRERREAIAEYVWLGRREEADALSLQADMLAKLAAEESRADGR